MRGLLSALWLGALACGESGAIPPLVFSLPDAEIWPDLTGYPGVGAGRIAVTNNLDDTVSIVDLSSVGTGSLLELARVPVGVNPVEREGPHHLTAWGNHYYVGISNYVPGAGSGPHGVHGTGRADGYALKIRAADNVEVGSVRVDPNPGDVRLTPDGRLLLVTHFDLLRIQDVLARGGAASEMDTRLAIVDPETMTRMAMVPLCPAAHGMGVAPDSRTVYVSCYSDELAVVDLAGAEHAVRRVPVLATPGPVTAPRCQPYAVTVSPDGGSVWVSCLTSGQVLRYDVAARAMDAAFAPRLAGPALFGATTADGATLVVPYQGSGGLAFLDARTGAVRHEVALARADCENPHVVRFVQSGRRLLVVCEGDHVGPGTLAVLDAASRTVEQVLPVGRFPDDLALLEGAP